jgi:hypothetical protein
MSVHGPPKYVNAPIPQPSAGVGYSMAKPNEMMIRNVIPRINGGKRKQTRTKRNRNNSNNNRKQKGGFQPSIGQSFVAAVSKYLAPIAMYGMYKFVTRKNKKTKNNKRRSTRRR